MPTKLNRFTKRLDLIFISSGLSVFIDGDKLTSKSQGLRASSMRTSKPSSSKQF
jgi:hypothetical protein